MELVIASLLQFYSQEREDKVTSRLSGGCLALNQLKVKLLKWGGYETNLNQSDGEINGTGRGG